LTWQGSIQARKRRPLATKAATSATGFAAGDRLAQALQPKGSARPIASSAHRGKTLRWRARRGRRYSLERTLRFAAFGLLVHGPACHYFYLFLDSLYLPADKRASAVAAKVVLDRVLLTPFTLASLFLYLAALEGRLASARRTLGLQVWRTWLLSNTVWPAAHVLNFLYVPADQRVLFVNAISLCWNVVLCKVASQGGRGRQEPRARTLPVCRRWAYVR